MNSKWVGAGFVAASAACLVGCGDADTPAATPAAADGVYYVALSVGGASALPKCTTALAGTVAHTSDPAGLWTCQSSKWLPIPCTTLLGGAVAYSSATHDLWACVSGEWTPVALPAGATGPQGSPGIQGPQGPQGEAGPVGPAGVAGPAGDKGDTGDKGDKGDTGDTGSTGAEGAAGHDSLVRVTDEAPGLHCEAGGERLDVGLDQNRNGALDDAEVSQTSYVCSAVAPVGNDTPQGPSRGVTSADLDATTAELELSADAVLNSDTGAIGGIRGANTDPNQAETIAGITFRRARIPGTVNATIGIFSFGKLTIDANVNLLLTGTGAVSLVSASDVVIDGVIDARGDCQYGRSGPGGDMAESGVGAGLSAPDGLNCGVRGGSGGSHARSGGSSGDSVCPGAFPASPYGSTALEPLLGGARGAGVSGPDPGGGAGGALYVVARDAIRVGHGSGAAGINAGGCGGGALFSPIGGGRFGGGGGGSGGAILLEATSVVIEQGGLAANGGGGGGGGGALRDSGDPGYPGALSLIQARGGSAGTGCGAGGLGGAGIAPAGKGVSTPIAASCTGGGGGSVGRIRINTASGSAEMGANAFTSPDASQGTVSL